MRTMNLLTVFGLFLVTAFAVSAQEGQRRGPQAGGPRGGGAVHDGILRLLIEDTDLHKSFDLSEAQVKKIAAFDKEIRAKEATQEERRKEMKEGLNKLLDEAQLKKVEVLRFQLAGGIAGNPSVESMVVALGLKEKQKEEIEKILADRTEKMRTLRESGNRDGIREKMTEIYKETREKVEGVLTAAEKEKAETLVKEGKVYQEKFLKHVESLRGEGRGEGRRGEGRRTNNQ